MDQSNGQKSTEAFGFDNIHAVTQGAILQDRQFYSFSSFSRTPPSRPRASPRSHARRAVLMIAKGQRPHPRRTLRRGVHLHDAADDGAFDEHVEVVIVPLAEERKADACLRMMALRIALGVFQPSPPWVS